MLVLLLSLFQAQASESLQVYLDGDSPTSCSYGFTASDLDLYFNALGVYCADFAVEAWVFDYPSLDFGCTSDPDYTHTTSSWSNTAPKEGVCGAGAQATQCPSAWVIFNCDGEEAGEEPTCSPSWEVVETWTVTKYFDHDGDGHGGEMSGWETHQVLEDGCGSSQSEWEWTWASNASPSEQDAYWDGVLPSIYQGGDCNDSAAAIHPGAKEVCDGLDNDCDSSVDEGLKQNVWLDGDGDGYGNEDAPPLYTCDPPNGYVANDGDACDDHADRTEPLQLWPDGDGDGKGDASASPTASCDPLGGYVANNDDGCDDHPTLTDPFEQWEDADGDGYGDELASPVASCVPLAGHVTNSADCGDSDSTAAGTLFLYQDLDGDGYASCDHGAWRCASPGPTLSLTCAQDCDPYDPDVNFLVWGEDQDGDGYGSWDTLVRDCEPPGGGYVANVSDCDDADPSVHPGVTWYVDGDGDGYGGAEVGDLCVPADADWVWMDCRQEDIDLSESELASLSHASWLWSFCPVYTPDLVTEGGDCNDEDPSVNPGIPGSQDLCRLLEVAIAHVPVPEWLFPSTACEQRSASWDESVVFGRLLEPETHAMPREDATCIDDIFLAGDQLLIEVPPLSRALLDSGLPTGAR